MAKVLLVEDDPTVARVLEVALKRAGHGVGLARDFLEALEALGQDWDAIVLDLNLPGGFGLDLLRHLRQELGKPTPVLVLSGLKQERTVVEALRLGAQDYLTKPFSPQELVLRLERYVAAG
ncbi:response regulator transcription factor [Thermus amyloliquefaciens]|uniref:response regulator transcription factor n=1 Tax=Thermus amyloliquefaciens TaxID=1449080 RepID=UPI000570365B|nr:response regulator transcription factor [Thermus amyloliquefaciens]